MKILGFEFGKTTIAAPEGMVVRPGQETMARILAKSVEKRKTKERLVLAGAQVSLNLQNSINRTNLSLTEIVYIPEQPIEE